MLPMLVKFEGETRDNYLDPGGSMQGGTAARCLLLEQLGPISHRHLQSVERTAPLSAPKTDFTFLEYVVQAFSDELVLKKNATSRR